MKLSEHETIARRTNPVAGHGMITTPHYLASQSGLAILRRGGTAVDAAIAAGATHVRVGTAIFGPRSPIPPSP